MAVDYEESFDAWLRRTVWDALAVLTADGSDASTTQLVEYIDDPVCEYMRVAAAIRYLVDDGAVVVSNPATGFENADTAITYRPASPEATRG